jgi:cytochrome c oxidase subunit IV
MSSQHHAADDHAPNVKLYVMVFAALMLLTVITVAISKVHLPRPQAIGLGLFVACVKASLVAAIFMHLWGEKKLIYHFLWVTGAAALGLLIAFVDMSLIKGRFTSRVPVAEQSAAAAHGGAHDARPHEVQKENAPPARLNKSKEESRKGTSAH